MATLTFDDLIPNAAPPSPAGGLSFDDLIPTDSRAGQFSSPAPLNTQPPATQTEDVLRSAATGLRRGFVSLPGIPGSLEQIGRAGVDLAARTMGMEDPRLSERTFLPTAADYLQQDQDPNYRPSMLPDKYWNPGQPHYQPQTTAGEYARTAGEFAPGAILPGGVAQRVLGNVAAPAAVSETAGQIFKGTRAEPWARAAGAVVGPYVPGMLSRIVSPNPIAPERAAQVATLRNEGVTSTTAGQETGRRPLQWLESTTGDMPLAGGGTARRMEAQAEEFTAAALSRAGINANRATPDVINDAYARLGQVFDSVGQGHSVNLGVHGRALERSAQDAVNTYNMLVPQVARAPAVDAYLNEIQRWRSTGAVTGEAALAYRSRIAAAARETSDPQLSRALNRIREGIDTAMERSLPTAQRDAWVQARREYRNLLVLERASSAAGESAALGLISPAQLRSAVVAQDRAGYSRGRSDLGELARAGVAIMTPLPQSGTAPRAAAQGLMSVAGAGGGALVGGAPGAAAGALTGALASTVAPGLVGRAVMSRPVQGYLRNQLTANAMANFSRREGAVAGAPDAARELAPVAENAMAAQSGSLQSPIPVQSRADVERVPRGAHVIDAEGNVYKRN